jgi:hypothetical protein
LDKNEIDGAPCLQITKGHHTSELVVFAGACGGGRAILRPSTSASNVKADAAHQEALITQELDESSKGESAKDGEGRSKTVTKQSDK